MNYANSGVYIGIWQPYLAMLTQAQLKSAEIICRYRCPDSGDHFTLSLYIDVQKSYNGTGTHHEYRIQPYIAQGFEVAASAATPLALDKVHGADLALVCWRTLMLRDCMAVPGILT